MKTTHVAAILSASAFLLSSCEVVQPPMACPVQRLTWATRLVLKEGQSVTGACINKRGERMGIQKYNDPTTGQNTLVIKPETLAVLEEADPDNPSYSLGAFPVLPDKDGICAASSLSAAEKHVPASGTDEAVDLKYAWKSAKITSTAAAPGSQFMGELTYTEGDCTAEYEVWGVWPSISCRNASGAADDSICTTDPHLNPDFALICDPTQFRCVPAKRPPSLR
jgi:hypothetical protein